MFSIFFFFNDTATTEIYTLSLHDALPICNPPILACRSVDLPQPARRLLQSEYSSHPAAFPVAPPLLDRKSTRLNSSHSQISYAVFCLKKTKQMNSTASPSPASRAMMAWHS